jgi:hypothetical protein
VAQQTEGQEYPGERAEAGADLTTDESFVLLTAKMIAQNIF